MSLPYWKREKNFKAQDKGYVRDPEGFPIEFLFKRLKEEMDELEVEIDKYTMLKPADRMRNGIFKPVWEKLLIESADVSNMVDYIYSKVSMNYPDKYIPSEDAG